MTRSSNELDKNELKKKGLERNELQTKKSTFVGEEFFLCCSQVIAVVNLDKASMTRNNTTT